MILRSCESDLLGFGAADCRLGCLLEENVVVGPEQARMTIVDRLRVELRKPMTGPTLSMPGAARAVVIDAICMANLALVSDEP